MESFPAARRYGVHKGLATDGVRRDISPLAVALHSVCVPSSACAGLLRQNLSHAHPVVARSGGPRNEAFGHSYRRFDGAIA
eukprot:s3794_g3.t1